MKDESGQRNSRRCPREKTEKREDGVEAEGADRNG